MKYNIPMFMSGYGDGFYATYIGMDKKDEVVKFIIDFGVGLKSKE